MERVECLLMWFALAILLVLTCFVSYFLFHILFGCLLFHCSVAISKSKVSVPASRLTATASASPESATHQSPEDSASVFAHQLLSIKIGELRTNIGNNAGVWICLPQLPNPNR